MRRLKLAVMTVALVFLLVGVLTPRRAAANSLTDGLIISGFVAGGIAAIALVAILIAGATKEDEPFEPFVERPNPLPLKSEQSRVRTGPACRTRDGTLPLLCW
jgi:hypothetical protein